MFLLGGPVVTLLVCQYSTLLLQLLAQENGTVYHHISGMQRLQTYCTVGSGSH